MGSASLFVGDISELIEACSASIFLFYMFVIIGLIIMRFTHKEEPRFYKVLHTELAFSLSTFPLFLSTSTLFIHLPRKASCYLINVGDSSVVMVPQESTVEFLFQRFSHL